MDNLVFLKQIIEKKLVQEEKTCYLWI
jgi:hypothetical protein